MPRVLVLVSNLAQASYRLRIAAIVPLMKQRGFEWDVRVRPRGWRARLQLRPVLRSAGEYDAVLVQRKFLDPSDAAVLRRHARRIFYDIDDALMHHNRAVGIISRWRTRRNFRATAAVVDHVVAGNEHLANIFRGFGREVSVIPTMVDGSRYLVKNHGETPTPRLVWIGSRSTIQYVQQFLPALERAAREAPGLKLLTIANATVTGEALSVEHEEWSEQTEATALCRGDIGIAPTPMNDWTMGKCGFKILQYMAAGLPVIASPVGANAELVQEGITGYLPKTPEDWPATIAALAKDAALRAHLGAAGRELAVTRYTLERAADDWVRVLSAL
jgi:glycosyltransferase involved in cell wall biosynthesis